ncbi:MAG: MFS transporter [Pseudomonadota bacterium]|nr:MFS transporter [Pseudomonadota bacterium]
MANSVWAAKGPLGNRNFRLILGGAAIGHLLMPLQFVTQILWVQAHAPEDVWLILVAVIGASRGVGALTFGLYGGALADRFDRRKLLLTTQALLVLMTIGITGLMLGSEGGTVGFVFFFLLTFLSAGLQSIDMPTRLAIVPDILGPDLTPAGMSLNQVAGQLAMPIALIGMGFIIDSLGFGGAYGLSLIGQFVVILFLARMSERMPFAEPRKQRGVYGFGEAIRDVRDGLAYARGHKVVLWVIVLLVTMMGLGMPAVGNLGPAWITTVIGVEIRDLGWVMMTWGLGSLVAALLMTRFASIPRRGLVIGGGALLFALSYVVFTIDNTVANVVIGNFGLGAGMTTAMVSSTILIQQLVPNEVRGRIMGILQLNMGFAQLMTMPVAILGQWLTLPVLFPGLALVTLGAILLVLATRRQILRA